MVRQGRRIFNTTLDEALFRRLKVVAAMLDQDMGGIVDDLLRKHLPILEEEASKAMLFPAVVGEPQAEYGEKGAKKAKKR